MEDQVMFEEMTNYDDVDLGEVTQSGSGNGLKIFGGVLALAGLGYGAYRLIKKRKAKKGKKGDDDGYGVIEVKRVRDVDDEDEE